MRIVILYEKQLTGIKSPYTNVKHEYMFVTSIVYTDIMLEVIKTEDFTEEFLDAANLELFEES